MKSLISKKIVVFILILTFASIKAADLNLSKEQKSGLFLIQKLYGPNKKKLTDLNDKLTKIKNSIAWIEELSQEQLLNQSSKIKSVLEKKALKIETIRQNLNEIKQALNRCPLSLKTDRAQQAIAFAGMKYLGELTPSFIENRINDLQTIIENIINSLK